MNLIDVRVEENKELQFYQGSPVQVKLRIIEAKSTNIHLHNGLHHDKTVRLVDGWWLMEGDTGPSKMCAMAMSITVEQNGQY